MKAKRLLALLPLAAIMALTSCGGEVDNRIKITFWHTFSYKAQIDNIVKKFEKLNPEYKIEAINKQTNYTGLKDMINKGFVANNYPDLALCYPDHVAEYIDSLKAVNFDTYIDNPEYGWSEEDKADILPRFMEEGQDYSMPGTYSLPLAKSTEAMFYNENVIGINLAPIDPDINGGQPINHNYINNLTWDEMFDKFFPALVKYNDGLDEKQKIIVESKDYRGLLGYDSDDNLFITLAEQYGYGYTSVNKNTGVASVDFNNDGMKGLMKKFNKAYKDGYIATKGTLNDVHPNDFFKTANCLFSIGSTGGIKYHVGKGFNVGVARIPQATTEKGKAKVINQGPSVCMLDHGDKAKEIGAWKFYSFMTNKENAEYWSLSTGYMPVRSSIYEGDEYIEYSDITNKAPFSEDRLRALVAKYIPTVTSELFKSPAFAGSSEAREQVSFLLTNCLKEKNLTEDKLNELFAKAEAEANVAI